MNVQSEQLFNELLQQYAIILDEPDDNEHTFIRLINERGLAPLMDSCTSLFAIETLLIKLIRRGCPYAELFSAEDSQGRRALGILIKALFQHDDIEESIGCIENFNEIAALYDFTSHDLMDRERNNLMHYAVKFCSGEEELKELVPMFYPDNDDFFADLFRENEEGITPFFVASQNDTIQYILEMLLNYAFSSPEFLKVGEVEDIPFCDLMNHRYLCQFEGQDNEAYLQLLEAYTSVHQSRYSPLDAAIVQNNLDIIKILTIANYPLALVNNVGKNPLEVAMEVGDPAIISFLQKAIHINNLMASSIEEYDEETLSLSFVNEEHINNFCYLVNQCELMRTLEEEACLEILKRGALELLLATSEKRQVLVQLLMRTGTDILHEKIFSKGKTILHQCILANNLDAIEFLFSIYPADVENGHKKEKDDNDNYFTEDDLQGLSVSERFDLMDFLQLQPKLGAVCCEYVNIKDAEGKTALNLAIRGANYNIIGLLLSAGAEVMEKDLQFCADPAIRAMIYATRLILCAHYNISDLAGIFNQMILTDPAPITIVNCCRLLNYKMYTNYFEKESMQHLFGIPLTFAKSPFNKLAWKKHEVVKLLHILIVKALPKEALDEIFKLLIINTGSYSRVCQLLEKLSENTALDNSSSSEEDDNEDLIPLNNEAIQIFRAKLHEAMAHSKLAQYRCTYWSMHQIARSASISPPLPKEIIKMISLETIVDDSDKVSIGNAEISPRPRAP
jgi:ankyrin repeat protein